MCHAMMLQAALRLLPGGVLEIGVAFASMTLHAQGNYPTHPVRVINPSGAGGNADLVSRIVAQKLGIALGQQFIIDNRAGGRSIIGTDLVAKAAADGYTLGFISSVHAINAGLVDKLPFDSVLDFAAISQVGSTPFIICIAPALPAKSIQELIALAKSKPGQISFADNGSGSRLAAELFIALSGTRMLPVPYKAASQAFTDLIGGDVQVMFATATSVLPHIRTGKIRGLAITGRRRSTLAPDLMTAIEAGLPGYAADIWTGVVAPARTPPAIVNRLHDALANVMAAPDIKERFAVLGADPVANTPAEFQSFIAAEINKWTKVIRDSGVHIE